MLHVNALNPELHRLLEWCNLHRTWTRGEGVWLYDDHGQPFLDAYAQYGAVIFGHNSPIVVTALQEALATQQPAMVQPYRAPYAVACAEALVRLIPSQFSHCVFTTSGAETVEAAIKLVRMHTGRALILSANGAYHGKTMGALAVSGQSQYQNDFGLSAPGFAKIPFGDSLALTHFIHQHHSDIAALFLEPIQGERGVILPPSGYLHTARTLCSQYGIALVLDEIQTGLGRTGRLLCCEHENVFPDIVLLAKGLGGGLFPLAACLIRTDFWNARFALHHSSTFANNNLACRIALAVIKHLTETDLIAQVAKKGIKLLEGLQKLAHRCPRTIAEVRGQGLLCAIQLRSCEQEGGLFRSYLEHQGLYAYGVASVLAEHAALLVLPTLGNHHVLRIAPPLTINETELEYLLQGLEKVFIRLEETATETLVRTLARLTPSIPARSLTVTHGESTPIVFPCQPRYPTQVSSYAFVMHYTRPEDILITDPNLAQLSVQELRSYSAYIAQVPPGIVYEIPILHSAAGQQAKGWLIALGMLPEEMFRRGRVQVSAEIKRAVDLAAELGAQVVGLGALTSPFSRHGIDVMGRGPVITTGNALTAGMSVAAIHHWLARHDIPFAEVTVGIVGARGAVGALCAKLLTRAKPTAVVLIGNPHSGTQALHQLHAELNQLNTCPIFYSTHLADLVQCQVIVSATSASRSVLDDVPFHQGTLICDVARPPDTSERLRYRTDLTVIEGGLVSLPDPTLRFGTGNIQGLPNGIQLACLSETILLALAKETQSRGIGAHLSLNEVDRVMALAETHGFRLVEKY